MKLIFFGSSEFSLRPLEYCLASVHQTVAVVTTPDRPKGRGLQLQPNPVKVQCQKAGVLIFDPPKLRDAELVKKIAALEPDLFVVASYGKLIPPAWLQIPRKLALNIHPSLLPKYRGAAPLPRQILAGEKETGVSIAEVTEELDAGNLFCQLRVPLEEKETTGSLTQKLASLSMKALDSLLKQIEGGSFTRTPQKLSGASYAEKLKKEEGKLDLNESAMMLERKIRAFHPWPGAFVGYKNQPLRMVEADCAPVKCAEAKPGTLLEIHPQAYLRIQTGEGSLKVLKVQLPGRQVIAAKDFANGQHLKEGFLFENLP